jgi:hypothetical protein
MIGNTRAALWLDSFCRSINQIKPNSTMQKKIIESVSYFESPRVVVRTAWTIRALDARQTSPISRLNAHRPYALRERLTARL